jgi:hypothetical protein
MYWLEQAHRNRDASLSGLLRNPVFRTLVGDPRYRAFLAQDESAHRRNRTLMASQARKVTPVVRSANRVARWVESPFWIVRKDCPTSDTLTYARRSRDNRFIAIA